MTTILRTNTLPALELAPEREASRTPWTRTPLDRELAVCAEETYVSGVLAGKLSADASPVEVGFEPTYAERPELVSFDLEVRVGTALAELWVSLGERDQAAQLFGHLHEILGDLGRGQFAGERRRVKRYLEELQPLDPRFVEWGD